MLALVASVATSCGGSPPTVAPHAREVEGLTATLEDEIRPLRARRIRWSTTWRLCWAVSPGAAVYELEVLTGEGVGSLRRQLGRCVRIEVAAGENRRAHGLLHRKVQLALAASELGYRVRVVLPDGSAGPWSKPVAAGETTGSPSCSSASCSRTENLP